MESCREWRAGLRVNERHWLLSASTVPRPLAFIKESYPFTLIKRQCFYLKGDPSEPASSLFNNQPPSHHLQSVHPMISFPLSPDLKKIVGWYMCNLYLPPKNEENQWLQRTCLIVIERQRRLDSWKGLSHFLSAHHQSLSPARSFLLVVGLIVLWY